MEIDVNAETVPSSPNSMRTGGHSPAILPPEGSLLSQPVSSSKHQGRVSIFDQAPGAKSYAEALLSAEAAVFVPRETTDKLGTANNPLDLTRATLEDAFKQPPMTSWISSLPLQPSVQPLTGTAGKIAKSVGNPDALPIGDLIDLTPDTEVITPKLLPPAIGSAKGRKQEALRKVYAKTSRRLTSLEEDALKETALALKEATDAAAECSFKEAQQRHCRHKEVKSTKKPSIKNVFKDNLLKFQQQVLAEARQRSAPTGTRNKEPPMVVPPRQHPPRVATPAPVLPNTPEHTRMLISRQSELAKTLIGITTTQQKILELKEQGGKYEEQLAKERQAAAAYLERQNMSMPPPTLVPPRVRELAPQPTVHSLPLPISKEDAGSLADRVNLTPFTTNLGVLHAPRGTVGGPGPMSAYGPNPNHLPVSAPTGSLPFPLPAYSQQGDGTPLKHVNATPYSYFLMGQIGLQTLVQCLMVSNTNFILT